MQEGNLTHRGRAAGVEGAYADVINGTNGMLDAINAPVDEARQVLARVAEHDLSVRVVGNYKGDHGTIKSSLNAALGNIGEAFASLTGAVGQVCSAAAEIGSGSQELASGASDQAGAINQVSNRLGVVGERTKASAADAHEARAAIERTRTDTVQGVERMQALAEAVNDIKKSADSTAKMVKTIDEIAFQTNLLALNAAVEAARNTAAFIEESVQKTKAGVACGRQCRRIGERQCRTAGAGWRDARVGVTVHGRALRRTAGGIARAGAQPVSRIRSVAPRRQRARRT